MQIFVISLFEEKIFRKIPWKIKRAGDICQFLINTNLKFLATAVHDFRFLQFPGLSYEGK